MQRTFKDFPMFYSHRFIQAHASKFKWTVSDKDKRPIDAVIYETDGRIVGASYMGPKSLVTLEKVTQLFPQAKDNTFYMNYADDGFVLLDIEKTCPHDIKQQLLSTDYIYGEKSASGQGYHLIFPLPDRYTEFPILTKKRVLRHPKGYYEILLNHYCMFTRNMIKPCDNPTTDFDSLFYQMAAKQKEIARNANVKVEMIEPPDIPHKDTALRLLADISYNKKPSDFDDDLSRFEFGFIANYNYMLKMFMETMYIKNDTKYTPTEQAWLLYLATKNKLPHRTKHDEKRNNLPWLLYIASEVIAKDDKPMKYDD